MQKFTRPSGLRLVLAEPPDDHCAEQASADVYGKRRVGVDDFDDSAYVSDSFLNRFHPVFSCMRQDDAGVGVPSTVTHPASESCQHDSSRVPKIPLAVPTCQFITDARQVVANPEQYADRPLLRRLAWMILMSQRGNVVDQDRLARMPVELER